jgi:hypothetical protein
MNREKIKLVTNVPLVIDLEDLGTETSSRSNEGVEYRYNCNHSGSPSMIYLPVDGHLAVKRAGAQPGGRIEIAKTLVQNRPRFEVRLFSDAHLAIETPVETPAPFAPRPPAPAPREIRMVAPAAPRPQQHQPYTNGAAAPQVAYRMEKPEVHPLQEMMTRCLEVGYPANQNAYLALRAQGIEIDPPTWEDVRSTGTSFFTQRMKGDR